MKCPDCSTTLASVSVSSFDKSYRCFTCGGFLTEPSSVNRFTSWDVAQIAEVRPDASMLKFGTGVCPNDGSALTRFTGESVPASVVVKRCGKCGFWWWPGDGLMKFKPAQEAKISYFKQWGIPSDLSALTLPVLALALLAVGLGVGLVSLRGSQKVTIEAGIGVTQFSATYLGHGSELVSFKTKEMLNEVVYKREDEIDWHTMVVENRAGVYVVTLIDLDEGYRYVVKILGREYKFETN